MGTVPSFDNWSAGEKVTAAKMQKNVRDAGNFFRSVPAVKIVQTTGQSLPASTTTTVAYDSVEFDTDGMADIANNRIVIKTPGLYRLVTQINAGRVGSAGTYQEGWALIRINNNAPDPDTWYANQQTTTMSLPAVAQATCLKRLAVGAQISTSMQQRNAAGTTSTTGTTYGGCFLEAEWIGA